MYYNKYKQTKMKDYWTNSKKLFKTIHLDISPLRTASIELQFNFVPLPFYWRQLQEAAISNLLLAVK